jgi:hypothetical protein
LAVLLAGPASASAPPALVASTIRAASLLAAGQAAGVLSAKVAALAEGVVQAMAVSKIKGVLAVVLVAGLVLGGIGVGVGVPTSPVAVAEEKAPSKAPAKEDRPPSSDALKKDSLDKALQLIKDSDAEPYDKVRLLAAIGGVQARRGAKKEAEKTFALALGLVKGVKNDVLKCGALGSVASNQIEAGDLKAARKTLAAIRDLRDKTADENVRLNATNGVNGVLTHIAAAQARMGAIPEAFKTAKEIESSHHQVVAHSRIAQEQAKRKDFSGAVKTIEQTDSIRIPLMLFEIAKIQEKTDKTGAEATWRLCAKRLDKLTPSEETDLIPERGGMNFRGILPALVQRGHGAAVHKWIDGLPSVTVRVKLLLILAGDD